MASKNRKKKILILGGITHMIDVVETMNRMGIEAIVTESNPKAPAKKIADKAYDVSTADIEKLLEIAEKEKIDGVFSAFEDFNTWNAQMVCEKLNLPFYATKEQLKLTSDKELFKVKCREFNLPVVPEYYLDEKFKDEDIEKISFPVIVKPVDSYGSKGISICFNKVELKKGYEKAISFSKSNKVIIEKFIDGEYGIEFYYTIVQGEVALTAVADRYVHKQSKEHPPLPIATIFPSKHSRIFTEKLDKDIKYMLQSMNLEDGVVLIEALYNNNSFYIYEMAFRLSGEKHYQIIEKQSGINLLEMMINLAIGNRPNKKIFDDINGIDNNWVSCNLSILLNEGTIERIEGLDEILKLPLVVSHVCTQTEGNKIEITGSYTQMFIRINIVANTQTDLNLTLENINKNLKVLSTEGEDMILTKFNFTKAGVADA